MTDIKMIPGEDYIPRKEKKYVFLFMAKMKRK
jgi:hypothetical protein